MAQQSERIFLALGVHPKTSSAWGMSELDGYQSWRTEYSNYMAKCKALLRDMGSKVVSWGECGLDYSHKCMNDPRYTSLIIKVLFA